MGAFEDFLGGAGRALELLREAYALVQQASEANGQARAHLSTAAESTSNPALSASLTRLAAVADALDEAAGLTVGGAEDFKAYLVLIGAHSAIGGGAESSPTREVPAAIRQVESVRHNRFRPEGMEGIRPYSEAETAEGNLFFEGGKHNTVPIKATPGRSPFRPGEIRSGWEGRTPANGGHVEGIAAAEMLHSGKTEASLYLNAEPCDKAGEGCKENASHFLKRDSVMWVHVQHENGTRFRKRITGTGRALDDDNS